MKVKTMVEYNAIEREWPILSAPFTAENGLTVEPIGSVEEGVEVGTTLRNGLMVRNEGVNPYYGWVRQGRGQIVAIKANGSVEASAFLGVKDGRVKVEFLRGAGNAELQSGSAHDALAAYVKGINNGSVPALLRAGSDGFETHAPESRGSSTDSLWAKSKGGSVLNRFATFVKLVMDRNAKAPEEQEDVTRVEFTSVPSEPGSWAAVSQAWTDPVTGVTVEPLSSRDAMSVAAMGLENGLAIASVRDLAARDATAGLRQFLVMHDDSGVLGVADVVVRSGLVVPNQAQGARLTELTPRAASGLDNYIRALNRARALNDGPLKDGVAVGKGRFLTNADVVDDVALIYERGPDPLPTMSRASASASASVQSEEWQDEGWEEDEDEDPGEDVSQSTPVRDASWVSVVLPNLSHKVTNGVTIASVQSVAGAVALGMELENALLIGRGTNQWTKAAEAGEGAILAFISPTGQVVANTMALVKDGKISLEFPPRGYENAPAEREVMAAWHEFAADVADCNLLGMLITPEQRSHRGPPVECEAIKALIEEYDIVVEESPASKPTF